MKSNAKTFRDRARASLSSNYLLSVLAVFIVATISGAVTSVGGGIGGFVSVITGAFGFSDNEGIAIAGAAIAMLVMVPVILIVSILAIAVVAPVNVGLADYFLHTADRKPAELSDLFKHFRNWKNCAVLYLLIALYSFLFSLLFVIPALLLR